MKKARRKTRKKRKMEIPSLELKKTNPLFYAVLGARGGTSTRDNHDSEYYRRIAELSHQSRRAGRAAQPVPEPGSCPRCLKRNPVKAARLRNNKRRCSLCRRVPA